MQRRSFTEEFKQEAIRLACQPGANKSAIARDLGIRANLLGRWIREQEGRGASQSASKGQADPAEFERMRRELAKVKMERDILKKRSASSLQTASEVCLYRQASQRMAHAYDVRGLRCFCQRFLRLA